jgi:hypothetical protein
MSAEPTAGSVLKTQAQRAARQLATPPDVLVDDIVVHADPVGAARLMQEIVALHSLDVALEEHDGHWQVVVRTGAHPEEALAKIVDLTARCVELGRMDYATLCVGQKSYTFHPLGAEPVLAFCAA